MEAIQATQDATTLHRLNGLCDLLRKYASQHDDVAVFYSADEPIPSVGISGGTGSIRELESLCLQAEPLLLAIGASIYAAGRSASGRLLKWVFDTTRQTTHWGDVQEMADNPFRSLAMAIELFVQAAQQPPSPPNCPAHLGLIVDSENRKIQRTGHDVVIDLGSQPKIWATFVAFFTGGERDCPQEAWENATDDRDKKNLRQHRNRLKDILAAVGITVPDAGRRLIDDSQTVR